MVERMPAPSAQHRRLLKEYSDFTRDPPPNASVYVTADDLFFWKATIAGPEGTPYAGGFWLISLRFPADYPFKPPRVRFETPIFHCNINNDGAVCLDILKDQWSPALTVSKVLTALISLLSDPNPDDPLDAYKAQLLKSEPERFRRAAAEHTAKYATLSEAELQTHYAVSK
eukprot:TRINITY_DN2510_c0_g1_i1.p1 TRINITY_DN2510_c0_g1~~TRINITY_DN2510_c0_g1_i1.p1  ORF type:complete len:171 (+),score=30.29 TRINITY_DN2510_c0_g1_i1:1156-1668(+)